MMTIPTERSRNAALVLEHMFAGESTRMSLVEATGLSKATVSRMVTDLETLGLARLGGTLVSGERGRRPARVEIHPAAGYVLGISLGLRTITIFAANLAGDELDRHVFSTPQFDSYESILSWLTEHIRAIIAPLRGSGKLLRVTLSIPARVPEGSNQGHLAEPLTAIEGHDLTSDLEAALDTHVMLTTDADMSLVGATELGHIDSESTAVLFTMSTVLTVATRTRRGLLHARSDALGDYGILPIRSSNVPGAERSPAAPRLLEDVLSVRGITRTAEAMNLNYSHPADLVADHSAPAARLKDHFVDAAVTAVSVAAVTTDPELCILSGRLAPLASVFLERIKGRLSEVLADPPSVITAGEEDAGSMTALGSVRTALDSARSSLVDCLREGALFS